MKMSAQQRARYCYFGLSLWIFLLMAATYKYLGSNTDSSTYKHSSTLNSASREFPRSFKTDVRSKRIFSVCNDPDDISCGSEGVLSTNRWNLEGILVLIRHGDRGPLAHVRNISAVNCGSFAGTVTANLLRQYKAYIQNLTTSGHIPWTQSGPFHGFPMLPLTETQCQLAQLTYVGVTQLLTVGRILNEAYSRTELAENITAEDVLVFSTKYRRTFQSGLAFLYGFLKPDVFSKVQITESDSVTFCFTDCACPAADHYSRLVSEESNENLKSHPAVMQLVKEAANIIYEVQERSLLKNPVVLKDALLTYVCHGASLPCVESINGESQSCVKTDHVASLFAYTEWETRQHSRRVYLKRSCMLKAYGLIRNIVTQMLKIVSERRPKVVLYSGHDWTLQFLSTALGVKNNNDLTQYASRLVFEIYKDKKSKNPKSGVGTEFIFRFIANGRDVTKDLSFCKGVNILRLGDGVFGCRIETIVRYIHDDYFAALNASNFKDACRL